MLGAQLMHCYLNPDHDLKFTALTVIVLKSETQPFLQASSKVADPKTAEIISSVHVGETYHGNMPVLFSVCNL